MPQVNGVGEGYATRCGILSRVMIGPIRRIRPIGPIEPRRPLPPCTPSSRNDMQPVNDAPRGSILIWEAVRLALGFILPVAGLGATAYVLGRRVLRIEFAGRGERWAVCTALGLGLIAHLLLLLGLAHLLRPIPVLLLAAGIHAIGIPAWRELAGDLREIRPGWRWGMAAVGLAPLVLLALYPPTAFEIGRAHV